MHEMNIIMSADDRASEPVFLPELAVTFTYIGDPVVFNDDGTILTRGGGTEVMPGESAHPLVPHAQDSPGAGWQHVLWTTAQSIAAMRLIDLLAM